MLYAEKYAPHSDRVRGVTNGVHADLTLHGSRTHQTHRYIVTVHFTANCIKITVLNIFTKDSVNERAGNDAETAIYQCILGGRISGANGSTNAT